MRKNSRRATLCFALAMALGSAAALAQVAPAAPKITEKPMGSVPEPPVSQAMSISGDNNHLAVLLKRGGEKKNDGTKTPEKYVVVVDGAEGKEYDWVVKNSLTFASDNSTVLYIVQQNDKMFVVSGSKEGTPYHEIVDSLVITSPAGGRVAYFAKKTDSSKRILVVDGEESKEYDKIGGFSFSHDGKHYAYGVETANQQLYVVDGQPGKAYDKIPANSFTWSPDSQHYAYAGLKGEGEAAKSFEVIDGKEQGEGSPTSRLLFSPDSQHTAYAATLANKKVVIVLDGKPQKEYDNVLNESLRFSPDSKRLMYVASIAGADDKKEDRKMAIVLDGKEQKAYDAIAGLTPRFSPDSKRIAYLAIRKAEKPSDPASLLYVVDDQEQRAYTKFPAGPQNLLLGTLLFSPDSKRFAFLAINADDKYVAVIDGIQGAPYDRVDDRSVQFSPDSKHFAYLGLRDNRTYCVVDNAEGVPYAQVARLIYNKDGSKMAYAATRVVNDDQGKPSKAESFVVVNNVEGKSYDGVVADTMAFSPDGAHLVYEAKRNDPNPPADAAKRQDKPFFVIDKEELAEHGGSLRGSRLVWDSPTSFHALVIRDRTNIFRVQVDLPAQ